MTREEEIHKIANTISTNIGKDVDEDYICNDEYDFTIGFESGAKWADEHPNLCKEEQVGMNELGMMWQKQALIKKVCEWLEDCAVVDIEEFKKQWRNEYEMLDCT